MTAEVLCIVSAFILGVGVGAIAGVVTFAIVKAAKDPVMVRAEDERPYDRPWDRPWRMW